MGRDSNLCKRAASLTKVRCFTICDKGFPSNAASKFEVLSFFQATNVLPSFTSAVVHLWSTLEQRQIVGERRRGLLHAFFPSTQSNPIQELCHFRDYKYSLRRLSPVNRLKACLNLPAIAEPFLVANHNFIRGFVRPLVRWSVGLSKTRGYV